MTHKVCLKFTVDLNQTQVHLDGDDEENIPIAIERLHTRHVQVITNHLLKAMHKLNKDLQDEGLVAHKPEIKVK